MFLKHSIWLLFLEMNFEAHPSIPLLGWRSFWRSSKYSSLSWYEDHFEAHQSISLLRWSSFWRSSKHSSLEMKLVLKLPNEFEGLYNAWLINCQPLCLKSQLTKSVLSSAKVVSNCIGIYMLLLYVNGIASCNRIVNFRIVTQKSTSYSKIFTINWWETCQQHKHGYSTLTIGDYNNYFTLFGVCCWWK